MRWVLPVLFALVRGSDVSHSGRGRRRRRSSATALPPPLPSSLLTLKKQHKSFIENSSFNGLSVYKNGSLSADERCARTTTIPPCCLLHSSTLGLVHHLCRQTSYSQDGRTAGLSAGLTTRLLPRPLSGSPLPDRRRPRQNRDSVVVCPQWSVYHVHSSVSWLRPSSLSSPFLDRGRVGDRYDRLVGRGGRSET